jgi:alpha-1,3-rhamnosyl/mannosyltransferase
MGWCFRHALAFAQTSRAESFSNIQVEALGHGCPVVSCNQPPMPEILADAALYYPTGDAAALAERLAAARGWAPPERAAAAERARGRAGFFSWDRCAEQTLDVLQRAHETFQASGAATAAARP